jgi:hypothetical protein
LDKHQGELLVTLLRTNPLHLLQLLAHVDPHVHELHCFGSCLTGFMVQYPEINVSPVLSPVPASI